MINYQWNFNPLTCYTHEAGYDDVVFTVHWQFSGTSGSLNESGSFVSQYNAQIIGTQNFTFSPDSGSFTPFNELTFDQVRGWVETAIGEERIAQMSASIAQQIQDQITPVIVNLPAPWAPTGSMV